jgi:hypothetical protein
MMRLDYANRNNQKSTGFSGKRLNKNQLHSDETGSELFIVAIQKKSTLKMSKVSQFLGKS